MKFITVCVLLAVASTVSAGGNGLDLITDPASFFARYIEDVGKYVGINGGGGTPNSITQTVYEDAADFAVEASITTTIASAQTVYDTFADPYFWLSIPPLLLAMPTANFSWAVWACLTAQYDRGQPLTICQQAIQDIQNMSLPQDVRNEIMDDIITNL